MIKINTQALGNIKSQIMELKGKDIELCVNRGRKRFDTIQGRIESIYPSVFTIISNDKLPTFSYFDILCGNVKIV